MGNPSGQAALLSTYFWPEVRRGTERLVYDLARELDRGGRWQATVMHGADSSTSALTVDEVRTVRVSRRPMPLARSLGYTEETGHLIGMRKHLRRLDADVAHAFGLFEAAVAAPRRAETAPALLMTVTGIPRRENLEGLFWRRRALARVVERAGAIVAISEAAKSRIGWMGGEQRVIYPGVDLQAFQRTRGRAPDPTILCTASSTDPRKRVPLVIDAFRELRRTTRNARLILSVRRGEPSPLSGQEPGIELRELDEHPSLVDAYSEAWLTVIASTDEAFGLVAVESLACGTPVVATADAGLVEAVGGTGPHAVLFNGDGPSELSTAMAEGLGLEPNDTACRQRAQVFSTVRSAAAYSQLYDELV